MNRYTLIKEQPDVLVLYENGMVTGITRSIPLGHVDLERYGRDRSGANLCWIDPCGKRRVVHFVGATEESVVRAGAESLVAIMLRERPAFGSTLRQPEGMNPPPLELRSPEPKQGQLFGDAP